MNVEIRPLGPELLPDYLDFFDHVGFTDHPEWSYCYCTFFHADRETQRRIEREVAERGLRHGLRDLARALIQEGRLTGYLAYADGAVAGWCNAGEKTAFPKLREDGELWKEPETGRVKAVVCFLVAPGARRQRVATALLEKVCRDAAEEGYAALEAYPANGELDCFGNYHGYPSMYERSGFSLHRTLPHYSIYRKEL